MSNDNPLLRNQIVLPSSISLSTFKDANGICWEISGVRENVGNVTNLDEDLDDLEDFNNCCEECIAVDEIDILDIEEGFSFSSSSSSSSSSWDDLETSVSSSSTIPPPPPPGYDTDYYDYGYQVITDSWESSSSSSSSSESSSSLSSTSSPSSLSSTSSPSSLSSTSSPSSDSSLSSTSSPSSDSSTSLSSTSSPSSLSSTSSPSSLSSTSSPSSESKLDCEEDDCPDGRMPDTTTIEIEVDSCDSAFNGTFVLTQVTGECRYVYKTSGWDAAQALQDTCDFGDWPNCNEFYQEYDPPEKYYVLYCRTNDNAFRLELNLLHYVGCYDGGDGCYGLYYEEWIEDAFATHNDLDTGWNALRDSGWSSCGDWRTTIDYSS